MDAETESAGIYPKYTRCFLTCHNPHFRGLGVRYGMVSGQRWGKRNRIAPASGLRQKSVAFLDICKLKALNCYIFDSKCTIVNSKLIIFFDFSIQPSDPDVEPLQLISGPCSIEIEMYPGEWQIAIPASLMRVDLFESPKFSCMILKVVRFR